MNAHWVRGLLAVTVIVAAVGLEGCATVVHGTKQKVQVVTSPEGATARAADQTIRTPGVLVLSRKTLAVDVRIEKEGYVSQVVRLQRAGSGAVWWNLLAIPAGAAAGGAIGSGSGGSGWFSGWEGAAVGSLVGGALLPAVTFGVDYGNGAAYELIPRRIDVRLQPVEKTALPR